MFKDINNNYFANRLRSINDKTNSQVYNLIRDLIYQIKVKYLQKI